MNGQKQGEPEFCFKHRVWKAVRDGESECVCTYWCVQGKTDEKCAPEKKEERETEKQTSMDGQENSLH